MTLKKLRPYQEQGINLIARAVGNGARAVLFVLSTGGGKSRIQAELIKRHLIKVPTGRVLVTVHRSELVNQLYDAFTAEGLDCGVVAAGSSRPANPWKPVQIASIQTLLAREKVLPGITLKLDDEAHHICADKWLPVSVVYKQSGALVVGFTATPIRADNRGLEMAYDDLVCPITMKQLIVQGFLVPYTMVAPANALRKGAIAQRPVDAYKAHALGRKCAVFAGNVKAAEDFVEQFNADGVPAAIVTGTMDAGLRTRTLARYESGELRVIVSIGVLGEGWDDPPTSAIIIARSLGSVALYLQICGRGLRISPSTGKTDCVIMDLHGSSHEFGPPDEEREWTLEGDGIVKKGVLANPFTQCKGCGVTIEGGANICDLCGIAKPELKAPDVLGVALVKFAAKRREGNEDRARTLARFMNDCVAKGHNPGAAFHRYKGTYGETPTNDIAQLAREMRRG